ncbi:fimbria/pilus outer membrane usher protein [Escherichia coli]|nr:fimbria/pilus outer membrane usher protein [Escherichia coli]EFA7664809.1 fimbria/pilus outer membrane usher protein [Escherichia coli]EFM0323833.1 fimbria/pilus outer membrane usher protein [Escherichia coli]EHJ7792720.1 fimbria/pilus outer membrane usher protein [Escherichia coli]EHL5528843.1 fimbria/pilus outer membrane usher protein [Escherichia coli]
MTMCSICHANSSAGRTYSFDSSFLNGDKRNVDLTLFEAGTQLPGVYTVDIILNGSRVDSREMFFHTVQDSEGKPYLKTCLTRDMLIRYGVKTEIYPKLFHTRGEKNRVGDGQDCADLSVIPHATEIYQFSSQQLRLEIPQVALRPPIRGIAPKALWDDGITAFLMNWQANVSRSEYRRYGHSISDNFWLSLEPGFNLGPWRIRNLMTWSKSSDQPGNWESVYTRAERGLNNMKSRLTLGDNYTPSDVFDSLPFRGVMLGSDESMVPYNQRAFAPVIRGVARTQARIEVRQNGYLIQSQTVAPGAFALTDLPLTSSGGDLQVTVLESDGTIQVMTVPFTTPAIALREGYMKYNVTVGKYRPSDSAVEHSLLGQLTSIYGLPYGFTAFGGVQMAEHYLAGALGGGWSLGDLGAISFDSIYARSQMKGKDNETGNTWRIRYNKSFELTDTSFTVASYQYSSAGYHSLPNVLDSYRDSRTGSYNTSENRRRRTTLNLTQPIGTLGSVSLYGSRDEYRDNRAKQDSVGVTLSSSWQNISWSVNGSRNRNFGLYKGHGGKTENRINLWMSIPLERWLGGTANDIRATTQILKSSGQDTQYEVGMNGNAFDRRLYWDISQELEPGKENSSDSSRLNLRWQGTYGELTGMYGYSSHIRQMSAGLSGGMIAHSEGITLGQKMGDTTALVVAPGVNGASVEGWPGVRTDYRGYTLAGYMSAYQENVITMDPSTFKDDAEVVQTDTKVVPTKGAVVKANFETRVGARALISLKRQDGSPVPFGSVVTLEGDKKLHSSFGIMGNNGEVYLSGLPKIGNLKAVWGDNSHCHASYHLSDKQGVTGIFLTRAVCM